MKNKKYTKKEVETIIQMKNEGLSTATIAEKTDRKKSAVKMVIFTVNKYLKDKTVYNNGFLMSVLPQLDFELSHTQEQERIHNTSEKFISLEESVNTFLHDIEVFIDEEVSLRTEETIAKKQEEIQKLQRELEVSKEIVEVAKKSNLTNGLKKRWGII